jgi:hypothetical protein
MSHTTIYFLTEAKDIEEAEQEVSAYLEGERFFDYFDVMKDKSGSLEERRAELEAAIQGWDWRKAADNFMEQAEKHKTEGNLGLYGYYLCNAGQLYAQYLITDTRVYNIDTGDYSIPKDDKGWWLIAVDFHY